MDDMRLTREQARAVDRYAVEVLGLPGVVLMENAGLNVAGAVVDLLRESFVVDEDSARVNILCGGGNNGGDGYVVARQLMGWGLRPTVWALVPPEKLKGDAAVMAGAWVKLGGEVVLVDTKFLMIASGHVIGQSHVVVDAMLGTGFKLNESGEGLREVFRLATGFVNAYSGRAGGCKVLAVDVPSGLDCETGAIPPPIKGAPGIEFPGAVRADWTVTFVAEKVGFTTEQAKAVLGRVVVADIGLPWSAVEAAVGGGFDRG